MYRTKNGSEPGLNRYIPAIKSNCTHRCIRRQFCTTPNSNLSRDPPEKPPPPGELRPRGKGSRFRQLSGIFSGKYSLFYLII